MIDQPQTCCSKTLPRVITLVGFMGAGKSTVGRALAARLRRRFIDLDDEIIKAEKKSVPAIFAENGEAYFRSAESRELKRLLETSTESLVLSLGGGAFVSDVNRAALHEFGALVVHLTAPVGELRRRVGHATERPLAQDPEKFRALYEQRLEIYGKADLTVNTGGKSVEGAALFVFEKILQRVHRSAEGASL